MYQIGLKSLCQRKPGNMEKIWNMKVVRIGWFLVWWMSLMKDYHRWSYSYLSPLCAEIWVPLIRGVLEPSNSKGKVLKMRKLCNDLILWEVMQYFLFFIYCTGYSLLNIERYKLYWTTPPLLTGGSSKLTLLCPPKNGLKMCIFEWIFWKCPSTFLFYFHISIWRKHCSTINKKEKIRAVFQIPVKSVFLGSILI